MTKKDCNVKLSGVDTVKCVWCGQTTFNDVVHYHGSVGILCKYGECRSNWWNFKYRIKNYKNSKYQEVKEFAYKAEQKVFEEKEPAVLWNDQLLSIRRLQKRDTAQRPLIETN